MRDVKSITFYDMNNGTVITALDVSKVKVDLLEHKDFDNYEDYIAYLKRNGAKESYSERDVETDRVIPIHGIRKSKSLYL